MCVGVRLKVCFHEWFCVGVFVCFCVCMCKCMCVYMCGMHKNTGVLKENNWYMISWNHR